MIAQIRAQRRTECSDETWALEIDDATPNACDVAKTVGGTTTTTYLAIGDTTVPNSLGAADDVNNEDGLTQDEERNILVAFADAKRPNRRVPVSAVSGANRHLGPVGGGTQLSGVLKTRRCPAVCEHWAVSYLRPPGKPSVPAARRGLARTG